MGLADADQRYALKCGWCGPSLLVLGADGWPDDDPLAGYWFRQTRFLRRARLRIGGRDPHFCSVAETSPTSLEAAFIHPEVETAGGGGTGSGGTPGPDGLLYRDLDLRVRYRVRPASLEIHVLLTNRWQDRVDLPLAWILDGDFLIVDEAMFAPDTPSRGEARGLEAGVAFRCAGCKLDLETRVTAYGAPWRHDGGRIEATVSLERQQTRELRLEIEATDATDPIDRAGAERREARARVWHDARLRLHAAAETPFVEFTERAASDLGSLALLEGPDDEWLTPAAGIPLYQSLWARDALTATWQAGIVDGGAALADVLATLTRLQGTTVDPGRDEQPGRILNQAKTDLHSRSGRSGFDRYYADVASPFMYIIGLGYHFALTGDRAHVRARYDAALRVMEWADRYGDLQGDGYVAYLTQASHGPKHQAWKDSDNAVVDADGRQVDPPIASCETQGYWYASLLFMSVLAAVMKDPARALAFARQAADLKRRFNRDFWMDDEGYLAFGLGPDSEPIRALTSNAAQCLATGIVDTDHVPRLVRRMFEPDLFSGWGIRTLSSSNAAYNPLDYHLGSVWPVENASIAFGLRRYGFGDRVHQLVGGLYDLGRLWPQGRIPECVGGYARDEAAHPGAFPRANRIQTWNQSAWPLLLQSLLGVVPCAPLRLLLVDPLLPPWLPELGVRGLRIGDASVDLRFRRGDDGRSDFEITAKQGRVRVVRQPWLESFSTDAWQRIAMLAGSFSKQRGAR